MNTLRLARRLPLPRPALRRRAFHSSPAWLSGHNKWSKIEKAKGANDMKRGMLYSRAYREIALAVRSGGSADPEQNSALAAVIKRSKSQGVPKENIETALKKISGENGKGDTHLVFEVMGPSSIGIIVECLSDNPNRTVKFLNTLLKDYGARMADVKFLFKREGRVRVALEGGEDLEARFEHLVGVALDADAEDFDHNDQEDGTRFVEFKCPQTSLHKLTSAVTAPGVCRELLSSELVYAPLEPLEVDDASSAELDKLVEAIEDLDDTLRVWTVTDS